MACPRFFAEGDNGCAYQPGQEVTVHLDPAALHHAYKVLRLHEGEQVEITLRDTWTTYCAQITYLSAKGLVVRVDTEVTTPPPPVTFDLVWGFAKTDKNDRIVRHATEIGAHRLIPVFFERCEVRFDRADIGKRIARMRSIAQSAAMQAHRDIIPLVAEARPFDEFVEQLDDYDAVVVGWEQADAGYVSATLDSVLATYVPRDESGNLAGRIALVIGPEGGITSEEIAALEAHGARIASMGPTILRVETACIVACGIAADRIRALLVATDVSA